MSLELYYVCLPSFVTSGMMLMSVELRKILEIPLEHGNGASVGLYVAFSPGVGSFGKMECHSYLILLISKLN